jgi:hypothetical protein
VAFPLVPILSAVAPIIERLFPDPKAAAEAKLRLFELEQAGELKHLEANLQVALAQVALNTEEAKSPSLFKSGWRPAVGWLCVSGFAYVTVVRPLFPWVLTVAGLDAPPLPAIDTAEIMAILMGMLGLGGMRSFERVKGKA